MLVVAQPLPVVDGPILKYDFLTGLYVRAASLLHQEFVHELVIFLRAFAVTAGPFRFTLFHTTFFVCYHLLKVLPS